jgi:hypothetical protein
MKCRRTYAILGSLAAAGCGLALLAGCAGLGAGASTHVVDATEITGALTADSEQQLVMTFVGVACEVSSRAEATDSGPGISVRVLVTTRGKACKPPATIQTAVAQLSAPWSNRVVLDQVGDQVQVIDGALIQRPSWLPGGYVTMAGTKAVVALDGKARALEAWGPPFETATSPARVVSCQPTPMGVTISQGYGIHVVETLVPGSHSLTDGTPVTVTTDRIGLLALYWTPMHRPTGWTVSLQAAPRCGGDTKLSLDTVMRIASGLH